ncbi:hypothetical protein LguiB_003769 [Lonicera macranthoides]
MYEETGLLFPYFHHSQDGQLEEFCRSHQSSMASTISEYYLGGEGDLFKAPEPIIEEPIVGLDAIPMISSCGEDDIISSQVLKVSDIELIQCDQLLSEVFYECKKDLLAKEATETPLSEVLNFKNIPFATADGSEEKLFLQGPFSKSVSSGCLSSMEEWMHGAPVRPNFLDFTGVADFGAAYGMRRAFSEGDIKTLGNDNVSLIHSPLGHPQLLGNYPTEDRRQKLSRYWNKKSKRNFGRKIKYACRKALADSQPRIRGRFAKTDDCDLSRN